MVPGSHGQERARGLACLCPSPGGPGLFSPLPCASGSPAAGLNQASPGPVPLLRLLQSHRPQHSLWVTPWNARWGFTVTRGVLLHGVTSAAVGGTAGDRRPCPRGAHVTGRGRGDGGAHPAHPHGPEDALFTWAGAASPSVRTHYLVPRVPFPSNFPAPPPGAPQPGFVSDWRHCHLGNSPLKRVVLCPGMNDSIRPIPTCRNRAIHAHAHLPTQKPRNVPWRAKSPLLGNCWSETITADPFLLPSDDLAVDVMPPSSLLGSFLGGFGPS